MKRKTFYNGVEPMEEDEVILKLSDAFEVPTDHPELELAVRVLNINPGHNTALLESCITLKQYMEFVTKVRECIDILTSKTIDNPLPYTDRLRIAISEAVDYCIAQDILGDFLKKHRSEVIAVTLYEYSEEEHRRIQERDKAELKEQLAEAETNLRQSETKLAQSNAMLQQSESKLAQSNAMLQQSESKLAQSNAMLQQSESKLAQSNAMLQQSETKLSQAIHNTISMLQNMGCDDAFICSKLCDVYQLSEAEALFYLEKK